MESETLNRLEGDEDDMSVTGRRISEVEGMLYINTMMGNLAWHVWRLARKPLG